MRELSYIEKLRLYEGFQVDDDECEGVFLKVMQPQEDSPHLSVGVVLVAGFLWAALIVGVVKVAPWVWRAMR